jgi:adenylate cyclase class 2
VIEAEAKYRSPGNDKVEKSLARLGAKKVSEGTIEDLYFAHPAKDFGKTDEALRLRKKNDAAELTYKGPRIKSENIKAREEVSVDVGSDLAAQRIVERLGFKEICVVRKRRKSYIYDKLRVDLDDVEGLGEFVELEILTESPDLSEQLFETAVKELSLDDLEPRTYLEMALEMKSSQKAED